MTTLSDLTGFQNPAQRRAQEYQNASTIARAAAQTQATIELGAERERYLQGVPGADTILAQKQALLNAAPAIGTTSPWEVDGVGSALSYAGNIAGQLAPVMAPAMLGGIAGAALMPFKASALSSSIGGALGAYGPSYGTMHSMNLVEQMNDPVLAQRGNQQQLDMASGVAARQALLESLMPGAMAGKAFGKAVVPAALAGASVEAATELGQDYISQRAAMNVDPTRQLDTTRLYENAIAGALGGGMMSGLTGHTADNRPPVVALQESIAPLTQAMDEQFQALRSRTSNAVSPGGALDQMPIVGGITSRVREAQLVPDSLANKTSEVIGSAVDYAKKVPSNLDHATRFAETPREFINIASKGLNWNTAATNILDDTGGYTANDRSDEEYTAAIQEYDKRSTAQMATVLQEMTQAPDIPEADRLRAAELAKTDISDYNTRREAAAFVRSVTQPEVTREAERRMKQPWETTKANKKLTHNFNLENVEIPPREDSKLNDFITEIYGPEVLVGLSDEGRLQSTKQHIVSFVANNLEVFGDMASKADTSGRSYIDAIVGVRSIMGDKLADEAAAEKLASVFATQGNAARDAVKRMLAKAREASPATMDAANNPLKSFYAHFLLNAPASELPAIAKRIDEYNNYANTAEPDSPQAQKVYTDLVNTFVEYGAAPDQAQNSVNTILQHYYQPLTLEEDTDTVGAIDRALGTEGEYQGTYEFEDSAQTAPNRTEDVGEGTTDERNLTQFTATGVKVGKPGRFIPGHNEFDAVAIEDAYNTGVRTTREVAGKNGEPNPVTKVPYGDFVSNKTQRVEDDIGGSRQTDAQQYNDMREAARLIFRDATARIKDRAREDIGSLEAFIATKNNIPADPKRAKEHVRNIKSAETTLARLKKQIADGTSKPEQFDRSAELKNLGSIRDTLSPFMGEAGKYTPVGPPETTTWGYSPKLGLKNFGRQIMTTDYTPVSQLLGDPEAMKGVVKAFAASTDGEVQQLGYELEGYTKPLNAQLRDTLNQWTVIEYADDRSYMRDEVMAEMHLKSYNVEYDAATEAKKKGLTGEQRDNFIKQYVAEDKRSQDNRRVIIHFDDDSSVELDTVKLAGSKSAAAETTQEFKQNADRLQFRLIEALGSLLARDDVKGITVPVGKTQLTRGYDGTPPVMMFGHGHGLRQTLFIAANDGDIPKWMQDVAYTGGKKAQPALMKLQGDPRAYRIDVAKIPDIEKFTAPRKDTPDIEWISTGHDLQGLPEEMRTHKLTAAIRKVMEFTTDGKFFRVAMGGIIDTHQQAAQERRSQRREQIKILNNKIANLQALAPTPKNRKQLDNLRGALARAMQSPTVVLRARSIIPPPDLPKEPKERVVMKQGMAAEALLDAATKLETIQDLADAFDLIDAPPIASESGASYVMHSAFDNLDTMSAVKDITGRETGYRQTEQEQAYDHLHVYEHLHNMWESRLILAKELGNYTWAEEAITEQMAYLQAKIDYLMNNVEQRGVDKEFFIGLGIGELARSGMRGHHQGLRLGLNTHLSRTESLMRLAKLDPKTADASARLQEIYNVVMASDSRVMTGREMKVVTDELVTAYNEVRDTLKLPSPAALREDMTEFTRTAKEFIPHMTTAQQGIMRDAYENYRQAKKAYEAAPTGRGAKTRTNAFNKAQKAYVAAFTNITKHYKAPPITDTVLVNPYGALPSGKTYTLQEVKALRERRGGLEAELAAMHDTLVEEVPARLVDFRKYEEAYEVHAQKLKSGSRYFDAMGLSSVVSPAQLRREFEKSKGRALADSSVLISIDTDYAEMTGKPLFTNSSYPKYSELLVAHSRLPLLDEWEGHTLESALIANKNSDTPLTGKLMDEYNRMITARVDAFHRAEYEANVPYIKATRRLVANAVHKRRSDVPAILEQFGVPVADRKRVTTAAKRMLSTMKLDDVLKAMMTEAQMADYKKHGKSKFGNYKLPPNIRPYAEYIKNRDSDGLNVWAGTGENAALSNLALRPLNFDGQAFYSVEHAYQTLKSGEFDTATYNNTRWKDGNVKISGRKPAKTDGGWNIKLMEALVKDSFEQNPAAAQLLMATRGRKITHAQDRGVWRDEFPRILMGVRDQLLAAPKNNDGADTTTTTTRVTTVGKYSRKDATIDKDNIYVFGDNIAGEGKGGQAVIRGLTNAMGIPTKYKPTTAKAAYFGRDIDAEKVYIAEAVNRIIARAKAENMGVVLPTDGIGTGRAQLAKRAPVLLEHLDNELARLRAELTTTTIKAPPTESKDPKAIIMHSGGAVGADTAWGDAAEKYGVKVNHYYFGEKTPRGNVKLSHELYAEAEAEAKRAGKHLNRHWANSQGVKNLLARNWLQVKNADAVFAIGTVGAENHVNGGTGYAVAMGILHNKPVFLGDNNTGVWSKWDADTKSWVKLDSAPVLTPNFAGVGTRELESGGRLAITQVMDATFGAVRAKPLINEAGADISEAIVSLEAEVANAQNGTDSDKQAAMDELRDIANALPQMAAAIEAPMEETAAAKATTEKAQQEAADAKAKQLAADAKAKDEAIKAKLAKDAADKKAKEEEAKKRQQEAEDKLRGKNTNVWTAEEAVANDPKSTAAEVEAALARVLTRITENGANRVLNLLRQRANRIAGEALVTDPALIPGEDAANNSPETVPETMGGQATFTTVEEAEAYMAGLVKSKMEQVEANLKRGREKYEAEVLAIANDTTMNPNEKIAARSKLEGRYKRFKQEINKKRDTLARSYKTMPAPHDPVVHDVVTEVGGVNNIRDIPPAKREEITAHIRRMRGKEVSIKFLEFLGARSSHGTDEQGNRVISIALGTLSPMSQAYHESMHDLMKVLRDNKDTLQLYHDLRRAASSARVMYKLRELLKDNPEALAQLEADKDERAAYMFEFYAEGVLNLKRDEGIVTKVYNAIRRVLGLLPLEERALLAMEMLQSGKFAEPSAVHQAVKEGLFKAEQGMLAELTRPLRWAVERIFTISVDQLRDMEIEAFDDLADSIWRPADREGVGDLDMGFTDQVSRDYSRMMNAVTEALRDTSSEQRAAALRNLQAMRKPSTRLELALSRYLKNVHKHLVDSGVQSFDPHKLKAVPLREVENYFPRVWDINDDNRGAFKALLVKYGVESTSADATIAAIMQNGGGLELVDRPEHLGYIPIMQAAKARKFDFINAVNAHEFVKFQNDDLMYVMQNYARQASHRAAFAKYYGDDAGKLKAYYERAKAQGATEEQLKRADTIMRGVLGSLGAETNPYIRTVNNALVTMQNLAVLPLALLPSLLDPIGIATRTGKMKDAWETFKNGISDMLVDVGIYSDDKDPHVKNYKLRQALAEDLAIVQDQNTMDAMGYTHTSLFMGKTMTKVNDKFFRWIGLNSWNNSMRRTATIMGMRYILANQNDAVAMRELGITKADVMEINGLIAYRPEDFNWEQDAEALGRAERVQNALYKFVNSTILRPNAATRSTWMSDPRWLLLSHLKGFTYNFHNVIGRRIAHRADRGEYMPAAVMAAYIPAQLGVNLLRGMINGTFWTRDMTLSGAMIGNAIQTSGVLGVGGFALSAVNDVNHSGIPGSSFLGPTVDGLSKLGAAATSGEGMLEAVVRNLPGGTVFKNYV